MIIKIEYPPNIVEIRKAFTLPKNVVFTYGEFTYNPDSVIISPDLAVHEETHVKQQQGNETVAKLWWQKYLSVPEFRLSQEVEAYRNQYQYICGKVKDRNARERNLTVLAGFLSSEMYGNLIGMIEAKAKIRNFK
jgi:hypothetical protein